MLKIKRTATNAFSKVTGIPVIKLSGSSDCWICAQTLCEQVPVRKLSYGAHNGYGPHELKVDSRKMSLLRVKQTCGVDQCVNPDHLVGEVKEFNPWG
jgi:hypothetical protein